jgi:predicted DNA binding CopG/RHH family protein
MKRRIKYTDGPIREFKVIKDFLPSPSELVFKHKHKKVTINLNQSSIIFFKEVGKTHHTPYQKVIRSVLDNYAEHFSSSN